MKLGRFFQTPTENKTYVIDYSQWLGTGETILSVSFGVEQATTPPLVISDQALSASLQAVSFFASGGVDGTTYEVEVTVETSTGQIKNDQVFYVVKEV